MWLCVPQPSPPTIGDVSVPHSSRSPRLLAWTSCFVSEATSALRKAICTVWLLFDTSLAPAASACGAGCTALVLPHTSCQVPGREFGTGLLAGYFTRNGLNCLDSHAACSGGNG